MNYIEYFGDFIGQHYRRNMLEFFIGLIIGVIIGVVFVLFVIDNQYPSI